jgi:2,5-diketo-D-gluconate reductase B
MLTAYSPIAKGKVADDPLLAEIGAGYGRTAVQVTLRWLIQQPRVSAVPRSSSAANRAANIDIFDFSLTDSEMDLIHGLDRGERLVDAFGIDWDA